jgi:hypothetical protein
MDKACDGNADDLGQIIARVKHKAKKICLICQKILLHAPAFGFILP